MHRRRPQDYKRIPAKRSPVYGRCGGAASAEAQAKSAGTRVLRLVVPALLHSCPTSSRSKARRVPRSASVQSLTRAGRRPGEEAGHQQRADRCGGVERQSAASAARVNKPEEQLRALWWLPATASVKSSADGDRRRMGVGLMSGWGCMRTPRLLRRHAVAVLGLTWSAALQFRPAADPT